MFRRAVLRSEHHENQCDDHGRDNEGWLMVPDNEDLAEAEDEPSPVLRSATKDRFDPPQLLRLERLVVELEKVPSEIGRHFDYRDFREDLAKLVFLLRVHQSGSEQGDAPAILQSAPRARTNLGPESMTGILQACA